MMNQPMPGARCNLTDVTQNMRKAINAFLDNHAEDKRKLAAFGAVVSEAHTQNS